MQIQNFMAKIVNKTLKSCAKEKMRTTFGPETKQNLLTE